MYVLIDAVMILSANYDSTGALLDWITPERRAAFEEVPGDVSETVRRSARLGGVRYRPGNFQRSRCNVTSTTARRQVAQEERNNLRIGADEM
jgi:hypothetical protein